MYITGKVDAVSAIVSNGWITEIAETNEYVAAIPMPDYDEAINTNAQPCEYYETSPAYIQDKTVLKYPSNPPPTLPINKPNAKID